MGFREKLRDLTSKAEKTAGEHKDEIRQTIDKAEAALDQRTSGKYHDKIEKADAKADAYLESLAVRQAQEGQAVTQDPAQPTLADKAQRSDG
ncbi:MAG: antitoxin [Solirubrobacteraceae bacterium]